MIARSDCHSPIKSGAAEAKQRDQTCTTRGVRAGISAPGGREGAAEGAHSGGARYNGPLHQHGSELDLVSPCPCMRALR